MRSKPNPVDQPERTAHYDCAMCIAKMLHNSIAQYDSTETVLLIFPFLQTNRPTSLFRWGQVEVRARGLFACIEVNTVLPVLYTLLCWTQQGEFTANNFKGDTFDDWVCWATVGHMWRVTTSSQLVHWSCLYIYFHAAVTIHKTNYPAILTFLTL